MIDLYVPACLHAFVFSVINQYGTSTGTCNKRYLELKIFRRHRLTGLFYLDQRAEEGC